MKKSKNLCKEEILEPVVANPRVFDQAAKDLCDKAVKDAMSGLHPLLQTAELEKLDRRYEFVQAFKRALEEGIARQLAFWQPCIQAVFQFNKSTPREEDHWDGTVHLLVMVTEPLKSLQALSSRLDNTIMKQLKELNWPRFSKSKSIVEIQQVTPAEVRMGIGYGAMFSSVHNAPVRVWPQRHRVNKQTPTS